MSVNIKMNMSGLMEISNIVNQKVALPLGERVARSAGDGYSVQSTPRSSVEGWARTRVFTETPAAMRREVRSGNLARALGGS